MRASDFTQAKPGDLIPLQGKAVAFVPWPLPARLAPDHELMEAAMSAAEAVAAIDQLAEAMTAEIIDPYILIYPLLQREAFYTSMIEGTFTTPRELTLFSITEPEDEAEDGVARRWQDPNNREVFNYIRAARHGLLLLRGKNLPVARRVITEAHEVLLQGVRGEGKHPGEYRTIQNAIGREGVDSYADARYVPPPPALVSSLMQDLDRYINMSDKDAGYGMIVRLAHIHYQFEAIHPFIDGNGRIGRLLVTLILCASGKTREPLIHMSPILARHDRKYRDLLLRVSTHGEWKPWTIFFLNCMQEAATEAKERSMELIKLRRRYIEMVGKKRKSALLIQLIGLIVQKGGVTMGTAAKTLNVSFKSAARHIRDLEALGILKETTGGKRNQQFIAMEVVECLFR